MKLIVLVENLNQLESAVLVGAKKESVKNRHRSRSDQCPSEFPFQDVNPQLEIPRKQGWQDYCRMD